MPFRSELVKLPCRVAQTPPSFLDGHGLSSDKTHMHDLRELTILQIVRLGKRGQWYAFRTAADLVTGTTPLSSKISTVFL